ncbi:hypothetical protein DFH08DRAFT_866884 [Mycena albidolilacea]|uniref:Histone-lysine N-methyltransferase n=1 Tax=Mycena albidolilacea TaxID=1033008 RepID=A0AAD7A215_9AGAR|nr:hypothetical protein DFH08DRAFT_866884 [Mycena albidolilacea]
MGTPGPPADGSYDDRYRSYRGSLHMLPAELHQISGPRHTQILSLDQMLMSSPTTLAQKSSQQQLNAVTPKKRQRHTVEDVKKQSESDFARRIHSVFASPLRPIGAVPDTYLTQAIPQFISSLGVSEQITIKLTYVNDGVNPENPDRQTWIFRVEGNVPLADLFRTVQKKTNEDDYPLKFFLGSNKIKAEDTPEGLGMTATKTHIIQCTIRVEVKIMHSTIATVICEAFPTTSFAKLQAYYIKKIGSFWHPERKECLCLKYDGQLVPEQTKLSSFKKRHLTLTAYIYKNRRQEIQHQWNLIAREAGAAEIVFVNEIDDEEVPPNIGLLFKYLERSYLFEIGVESDISPLSGCVCEGVDCTANLCHGQRYVSAYNSTGRVHHGVSKIFECNERCPCPSDCCNRVAQRPRQIGIQIFKTEKCGWGVRATVEIRKRSILGIYTGMVIRRQDVGNLVVKTYTFDLDGMEDPDEEPPENSYSVDAFGCGNWTRFINHSCEPNLKVIPAVYDTMPEDNIPYLAFVATQDISAYSELSFDYNPPRQQEWEKRTYKEKGKTRSKRAKKETRCMCGSKNCRGFL